MVTIYDLTHDKFLMRGKHDDKLGILEMIIQWADQNTGFDCTYFDDLYDKLLKRGKISKEEYNRCVRVYNVFNMNYYQTNRE